MLVVCGFQSLGLLHHVRPEQLDHRLVADDHLDDAGRLAQTVAQRHPDAHAVRSERALYDYVSELKARHMKSAPPLAKVAFDPTLHILKNALGAGKSGVWRSPRLTMCSGPVRRLPGR